MFDFMKTVDYNINGEVQTMTDITISVVLKRMNIDRTFLLQDITINESDSLESISNEYYGTPKFWWVIMIVNDIVNPLKVVLSSHELIQYTKAKYGDAYGLNHFTDSHKGRRVDDMDTIKYTAMYEAGEALPAYIIPVSHIEVENKINLERMHIKLINKSVIGVFEETFKDLTSDNE